MEAMRFGYCFPDVGSLQDAVSVYLQDSPQPFMNEPIMTHSKTSFTGQLEHGVGNGRFHGYHGLAAIESTVHIPVELNGPVSDDVFV